MRIATILILIIIAVSCATQVIPIYIGEAHVIQRMENGNYEVTPQYVIAFDMYKKFYEEKHKVTEAE